MGNLSPHFSREEFECNCHRSCIPIAVDCELVAVLEKLREHVGKPVRITSAYRCAAHNTDVGGAKNSQHRLGIAADIQVDDFPAKDIAMYLRNEYPNKYGIGEYEAFTHIDVRRAKARWNG